MKTQKSRFVSKLLPLAVILMLSGLVQAVEPPRVMFVSGLEIQPVIIDLEGKEFPAKKGVVIPPGYSVKVPEGATVQIMTDEKAIVAIRQNSLLKLEKLGEGGEPHKFRLDIGGLRVANSEKKPHKFEIDTPNAKIRFDKGDHEAFYLKEGKLKDGRWGTFVRGFKEESVLSTRDGDTKVTRTVVGYVPGMSKDGKTELIGRINVGGNALTDPVTTAFLSGSSGQAVTDLNENQRVLSENSPATTLDPSSNVRSVASKGEPIVVLSNPKGYAPPELIKGTPLSGLPSTFPTRIDSGIVANLNPNALQDPNKMRQLKVGTLPGGEKLVLDLRPQSIGVVSQDPAKSETFRASDLGTLRGGGTTLPPKVFQEVKCSGKACF